MTEANDPLLLDGYLVRNAVRTPNRVALSDEGGSLTYTELDRQVNQLAGGLLELGVGVGDRVGILLNNCPEFVVATFAALRVGAIVAPVNPRLTPGEIGYVLDDLEPRVLVTAAGQRAALTGPAQSNDFTVVGVGEPFATGTRSLVDFADLTRGSRRAHPDIEVDAREPAFILYTSGTTGRPKGAMLSNAGYVVNSLAVLQALRMTDPTECRHIGVSMFHSGGMNSFLQQIVLGAASFVSEPGGLKADDLVDLFDAQDVHTAFLTPTQWQQVCRVPGVRERRLRLRRLIWGTSHTPPQVLESMHDTFPGLPVFAQFGMTETSGTTCSLPPEFAASKIGSVGRPLGHMQLRLVDPGMRDVGPGDVGEIVYWGPSLLRGYWRDERATKDAFSGGWFHSGDLARWDEDGFLFVVDRLKDMIVSGGENIYSSEVENALSTHPKVAEVMVVGVPHPKWVESPRAVVVPVDHAAPPTLVELQEHIRPILAVYKRPTSLELVDALPRNTLGKVLRRAGAGDAQTTTSAH